MIEYMIEPCKSCPHWQVCPHRKGVALYHDKIKTLLPDKTIGEMLGDDYEQLKNFTLNISVGCIFKTSADRLKTEATK